MKRLVVVMEIATSLVELAEMHPNLEWQEISAATVAVLDDCGLEAPFTFPLDLIDLPGFGTKRVRLVIDRVGIPARRVAGMRRTYETSRRIELTAIAIAALALYHGGGHEIVDVPSGAVALITWWMHLEPFWKSQGALGARILSPLGTREGTA